MSKISEAVAAARVTCVVGVIERCDHPETGMHRTEYGSAAPGGPGTLYCVWNQSLKGGLEETVLI